MAIPFKNLLCGCALVAGTVLVTTQVVSQDFGGAEPSPEEMMAMWMELATPGPEHAKLMESAGTWKQKSTHWMEPGAPPTVSPSTATLAPILGGRFMMETLKGEIDMGGGPMPFEGIGIFGYDNGSKKHTFLWADTMGTAIMMGEGTANESGTVVTYMSKMNDPFTKTDMTFKCVSTVVDSDHSTFEMFMKTDDGWFRNMLIEATRTN